MDPVVNNPAIELVETDVSFGPRTALICDAHNIPFAEGSFDGVVAQAVLEHVLDPYSCVAEIYRVLKPAGLVYVETPFMQQVHMGRYDFTRFTHWAPATLPVVQRNRQRGSVRAGDGLGLVIPILSGQLYNTAEHALSGEGLFRVECFLAEVSG